MARRRGGGRVIKRYVNTHLREKGGPCEVCGDRFLTVRHHDDYAFPDRTRWLCRRHHAEWHRKNGPGANRSKSPDVLPFPKDGGSYCVPYRGLVRSIDFWATALGIDGGTLRYRLARKPVTEALRGASLRRAHRVFCRECGGRMGAHRRTCSLGSSNRRSRSKAAA